MSHSERVRAYSMLIAERMNLPQAERDRLQWGALAHDVGKLAVAPEILNKPGRLNENEWHELRAHPAAAASLIEPLREWLGEWTDAATQHHERFDGRGYPAGLAGDEISLSGRIRPRVRRPVRRCHQPTVRVPPRATRRPPPPRHRPPRP